MYNLRMFKLPGIEVVDTCSLVDIRDHRNSVLIRIKENRTAASGFEYDIEHFGKIIVFEIQVIMYSLDVLVFPGKSFFLLVNRIKVALYINSYICFDCCSI